MSAASDRLRELRTTGFRPLKPGRIHVRCYVCGRKRSNILRDDYDPAAAVLVETACEKHDTGCGGAEMFYYDAAGVGVEPREFIDGSWVEADEARAARAIWMERGILA